SLDARTRRRGVADGAVAPTATYPTYRPDADPQPARLANAPSHAQRLEAGRPHPLPRRHALHVERLRRAGGDAPRRGAGLRPGQLLTRRARGRAPHPAPRPRPSGCRAREPAVLRGRAVPASPRPEAADMGRRVRLRELGPVLSEMDPGAPGSDLRDSGDEPAAARRRQ